MEEYDDDGQQPDVDSYLQIEVDEKPFIMPTPTKNDSIHKKGFGKTRKSTESPAAPYGIKSEIPEPPSNDSNDLFVIILDKLNTITEDIQNMKQTQKRILTKLSILEESAQDHEDNMLSSHCCMMNRAMMMKDGDGTRNKAEAYLVKILPITDGVLFEEIEEKLQDEKFARNAKAYFKRLTKDDGFEKIFRRIATDDVYFHYNVDGMCKKNPLIKMKLFDHILFECYSGQMQRKEYTSELRKCILKSHNRHNRLKAIGRKKQRKAMGIKEEPAGDRSHLFKPKKPIIEIEVHSEAEEEAEEEEVSDDLI